MKSIVCFIIVSLVGGALCDSEICSSFANKFCKYHEIFPMDYPTTVEDMKESCKKLQDITKCFLNYFKTCGGYEEQIPWVEKFLGFVEEKCQEDSDAFQAISRNLDCFTPTLRSLDKNCSIDYIVEEDFEGLISTARNLFPEEEDFFVIVDCLEAVWQIKCKSHTMGQRCGLELKSILSEILESTNYNYVNKCNKEVVEEFEKLQEDVERVVSENKWLENSRIFDYD